MEAESTGSHLRSTQVLRVAGLGLESHYMGYVHDDATLALLYSAADVLVMPGIQEVFPLTVLESLACGTPCVAFQGSGIDDLISHRQNGFLAPAANLQAFTKGIAWVLEDESRRQCLCRNARETVLRKFSLELVARMYSDLYEETLSR